MSRFKHTLSVLAGKARCITIPIPAARSITLLILVRVGSRFEAREHKGISHFMEHMFFKGAERYPDTMAVAGAIDGAGGSFNAFTSEEVVGYFVKISSLRKEIAYDVLSDMLLNAKFAPEEILRERGVIIEEIRMNHDDPMSQVSTDFHRLFFGDQPLGWDVAGTEAIVSSMTREDFLSHHKKFYYGANCVITAAGDITPEENEALCSKYFKFSEGGAPAQPEPFVKKETGRIFVHNRETEQAHFIFGFPSCAAETADEPKLKVLSTILGGSMSSRLFHQIRERRGLAYYINSSVSTYFDTGIFQISSGVNLAKINDAIKYALDEVQRVRTEPVTAEELTRAKENIKGHTDLALEDSRRVASLYGIREILFAKIKTPEELMAEVDALTVEDLLESAKKYLGPEGMKLAVVGPFKDSSAFEETFRLPQPLSGGYRLFSETFIM
ncbi:MAG: insulinase family protein [Nitrospinae bacterium]|nr:insulinase family protein [Nitrospinota bacterium]